MLRPPLLDAPPTPVSVSELPFSRQPRIWARARFRTALAALPKEQRVVFVQRVRGDVGLEELAQALGLEVRRVRQVLFHAMRQMREDLAEAADGEDDNAWLARCRELVGDGSPVADLAPLLPKREPVAKPSAPQPTLPEPEPDPAQDSPWLFPGLEVVTREQAAITDADIARGLAAREAIPNPVAASTASQTHILVDPAMVYVPSAPLRLPSAPPRAKRSGWKWMSALIVALALAAVWLWWPRVPSTPPAPAAASQQTAAFVPAPALPPPLTSADLPMLALKQAQPDLLDRLSMLIWLAEVGAPAAIAASPAVVEPDNPVVSDWPSLPEEQRRLLAGWAQTWPRLPETARRQLAMNAQLWLALDETQRQLLTERIAAWDAMPAAERLAPRARFDAWQQLGPEGRATARAAATWLAQASPEQQQELADTFQALPLNQQSRFLRDAATRDVFDTIDAVFPFVPETARTETLALVRALQPAARTALREQAKRMSPQQREALRKKLLALPADARASAIAR